MSIVSFPTGTVATGNETRMNPSQKALRPKPPDKGSFPLDHDGECKEYMQRFMECLERSDNDNSRCRSESKAYLKCRMDRELMATEAFSKLGYHNDAAKTGQ